MDDRAASGGAHLRCHRLRREEVMPEVGGEAVVPELRRHLVHPVPVVATGIVDQHPDGTERLAHLGEHGVQRLDVADVAAMVVDLVPAQPSA